ncbi:MAG TPA: ABC transporter permease [Candidatus Atribacteria bacterium]|nr:ABC transporter permease [Candidatus Atribacteria bacterium]
MAVMGGIIILVLIILAIFAPYIAPYHYAEGNLLDNFAKPSTKYLLGADFMGRDLLSRIIYGTRISLSVGIIGALTAFIIGVFYGVVSGYFGGKVDDIMMRFVDIMYGFPTILLIILLMVLFKSTFAIATPGTFAGYLNVVDRAFGGLFFIFIGIGVTAWLGMARIARGMALSLREKEFVEAAKAEGATNFQIIVRHIMPNLLGPCIVRVTLDIPRYVTFEAFLSFIGLGVNPPTPSWGMMISEGYKAIRSYPHLAIYPGLALAITMMAFNFLGDGLRDALDPRMK